MDFLPDDRQRRLDALAPTIDLVTAGDRAFFERHSERRYRVRVAAAAEIEQLRLLHGTTGAPHPASGYRWFVLVRQLDDCRMRQFATFPEDAETDLPEDMAELLWIAVSGGDLGGFLAVAP